MRSDTCAFPSWPRRSALSDASCTEPRASSYLSDDDLFPAGSPLDEDDLTSVSSAGSSFASPVGAVQVLSGSQLMEMQRMERQRKEAAKEYVRMMLSEKEKKRSAKKGRRSSGGSSKKTKKGMAPISEGLE